MTKKQIKELVEDEIAMEKLEIEAAKKELYHEFSMHGGDGPWNNYGGDKNEDESEDKGEPCQPLPFIRAADSHDFF